MIDLAVERLIELALRDAEMRCAPHWPAFAEQNRLGRLVADAKPRGGLFRKAAVALHSDQLVARLPIGAFDVRVQLIERFAADSTGAAVFEKEDRPFAGLSDGSLKLVDVGERR